MKSTKKNVICICETPNKKEATKMYNFYNTTKKNTRLTYKKGVGYRVWIAND